MLYKRTNLFYNVARIGGDMMKNTRQKEIILDAVSHLKEHPTADEIYLHLKKDNPKLSLATVYRNLNQFAAEGRIRKVSVPGDSERYDAMMDAHEHFYCESCGTILDIHINGLEEQLLNHPTMKVDDYKLMLFGKCEQCRMR